MTVIRAAVVQTDPVFGAAAANLDRALALVPGGADLAVLPELCTTGYQFRDRAEALAAAEEVPAGPTCARLREHAAAHAVTLVAGLAERAGDAVFNTAVLVRPDRSVERYRKVHLFWDEKAIFAPGDLGLPVFAACGTTIGLLICFDWIFPEAARTLALRGAQVLCHPANLVLPHAPRAMPVRAVENRVYTLTANRVGVEDRAGRELRFIGRSCICSPDAETLATCSDDRAEARTADLDLARCAKLITPTNDVLGDRRPESYDLG